MLTDEWKELVSWLEYLGWEYSSNFLVPPNGTMGFSPGCGYFGCDGVAMLRQMERRLETLNEDRLKMAEQGASPDRKIKIEQAITDAEQLVDGLMELLGGE